jgi:hypothetical protein
MKMNKKMPKVKMNLKNYPPKKLKDLLKNMLNLKTRIKTDFTILKISSELTKEPSFLTSWKIKNNQKIFSATKLPK